MLINSIDAKRRQEATFLAYPDPPAENFGTRLKRLAKEKGLSNKDLVRVTGAHEVTVSRWMGGQEPKGVALIRLSRLLDVTPEYLLADLWTEPARQFFPKTRRTAKPQPRVSQRKRNGASG